MKLRFAALSDVGRVRRDNQDSGYAGSHLLVVADGVGGSARGDVASSTAVSELRVLDRPPGDQDPLVELNNKVHQVHHSLRERVRAEPELDGTSTTVTAGIFDGQKLNIAHVGDSRAYLLREGTLSQLTKDHSFVQSLIDEGRISEDEARTHPHRNLILRAVDGVHDPEADLHSVDLVAGDRIMLCSDGCSGVFSSAELASITARGSVDEAAIALVRSSLDQGSTDNVTVVLADVLADDAVVHPEASSHLGAQLVGAAGDQARSELLTAHTGNLPPIEADIADEHDGQLLSDIDAEIDPEHTRYAPRPPRRLMWLRRSLALLIVAGLVWGGSYAAYQWTQNQFYVANADDVVAIYRGVQAEIPFVELSSIEERSDLLLEQLPEYSQTKVKSGLNADDLSQARSIVSNLKSQVCVPASTEPKKPANKNKTKQNKAKKSKRTATATPAPTSTPKKSKQNKKKAAKTKQTPTATPTTITPPECDRE